MNRKLYRKLAWMGIKKNKQLYYPYLIAGATMVMVFYILAFLGASDTVHLLPGGAAVTQMLTYGSWAIGLFSLPFLFYTNSSLIKKRKKELGLYNILGMNKRNILSVMMWETLITYGIAAIAGIYAGIILSKAAELGIVNIMGREPDYSIHVEWKAIVSAVLLYAVIYILLYLNTIRQVHSNNPIELLRSASAGERPPKGSWLLAAAGVVMIIAGYVMAVRVGDPQEAMTKSVRLAILIAAGTYLLFIAGSVFLCRLLQKNKSYYYQTSHFVTISSLSYRMKRNGASLASICILATLILVALVTSVGFYSSSDKIVLNNYPFDLSVSVLTPDEPDSSGEVSGKYKNALEYTLQGMNANISDSNESYSAILCAPLENGTLDLSVGLESNAPEKELYEYREKFAVVRVMSLEDYNRICDGEEELGSGEVLIASENISGQANRVRSWDGNEYTVKRTTERIPKLAEVKLYKGYISNLTEKIYLVVPDMELFWRSFQSSVWSSGDQITFLWEYDADLSENTERQLRIGEAVDSCIKEISGTEENYTCSIRAERAEQMNGLSGGLMFLAFVVSAVFIFVATLIMYYKQISEGYEDQRQFAIMKKIGMTGKEIRRSINFQMLTVFGFPLITAGIHLIFGLPVIYQIMEYGMMNDKALMVKVALISFLIFAVGYSLVYMLTTRTYFKIVNRSA